MDEINVQVIDMDVMIPEHVTKNHDGSYTIFLNARFSQEYRLQAYMHAIEHIKNGDFDTDYGDVQDIECVAHNIISEPSQHKANEKDNIVQTKNTINNHKRRKHRKNRSQERYVCDRVAFLSEHCDLYAMAEHNYLYGKDL